MEVGLYTFDLMHMVRWQVEPLTISLQGPEPKVTWVQSPVEKGSNPLFGAGARWIWPRPGVRTGQCKPRFPSGAQEARKSRSEEGLVVWSEIVLEAPGWRFRHTHCDGILHAGKEVRYLCRLEPLFIPSTFLCWLDTGTQDFGYSIK